MSVQDVKDTFYATLRDRVAAANPARTIALRGVTRPAVIVAENELPTAAQTADAFCLCWTALSISPLGMIQLGCEIRYATAGSTGAAGMDRGRALAALDTELRTAVDTAPQNAPLVSVAEIVGGGASTEAPAGTNIFWTGAALGPTLQRNERLERTVTVEVFGYE